MSSEMAVRGTQSFLFLQKAQSPGGGTSDPEHHHRTNDTVQSDMEIVEFSNYNTNSLKAYGEYYNI
jgi:hypothetical protein